MPNPPRFDPNQPIQDFPLIDRKIITGKPLTEKEAETMLVQQLLRWGEGQITIRELFRRLTIVGSLLDLDRE